MTGRSSSSRETCCIRSDGPLVVEVPSTDERQGNLLQDYEQRFERPPEDQKLSKLCSEAGLNSVEVGKFCYALPSPEEPNIHYLEKTKRKFVQKGGSEAKNDSVLSWR